MLFLNNFLDCDSAISTEESENWNKFHLCTNFLLFISVFFGLFPIHGLRERNIRRLEFRWKSPMVLHSIFLMMSGLIVSLGSIPWILTKISMQGISNFVFFFRGFLTGLIFFKLAQKWPAFLRKIEGVEFILRQYPPSKNIRKQLKILNTVVLLHATVEHCLVQLNLFVTSVLEQDGDILLGFKRFFVHYSYGYMFNLMPYTLMGGFWIQYTNVNLTFSWTFLDMFICSTSIITASKIYQINCKVKQLLSKEITMESDWRIVREDFSQVFLIFKEYNKIFNPLLVLSFTVNVYFLLVQLFGAMKYPFTPTSFMYYVISFGLLVIRLVSVCMGGAKINEESRKLTILLATAPSFIYNDEIKRFLVHLKLCPTILSVDNYFQASKRTMLKIFGALVAYEVILIQFDKELITYAVEHFLEDIHKISLIKTCGLNFSKSVEMFLKHFIIPDVFTIISYTFVWGIILEIMSLLLTFSWTFIDIFIILISWCLAERFFQITRRVRFLVRTRVSDEKQWEKIRNDYIRLCQLCRLLDEELSFIILQSFASNMFFILTQLFNSFQFKAYSMEKIYFCFSFFTLILRMFFVCVVAGMVNGESSKPLIFLSEAPTTIYNKQIQRFAEYIHWNNISLTGRRYFIITKGLLLNITGAIITYELVLLQFEGHTIIPNEVNETSKFFNCDNLLDN
ncbi:gustatory receptor for sugar taste 64b-like [Coccinella septempunctata]|uniref:gustatory receptor for sugar taste 64b-like n=1 Tax=Coccinella septempunctata TaxID=41139 RepID=UPI001D064329|nr:gustatory receptor for sugar taste 64b-like [Coccinella septempunctata]